MQETGTEILDEVQNEVQKLLDNLNYLIGPEGCFYSEDSRGEEREEDMHDVYEPDYYKAGMVRAIDLIEAFDMNFNLGCAIKYVVRAGKKSKKEWTKDLHKACWYIEREIGRIEKKQRAEDE